MAQPFENKKTILIVDDTPQNIDVLAGILSDEYKVKAALNGERALNIAIGASQPDLILLDVMMPGMDGYEVCRRLKADEATRHIPVVFVTAKGENADRKEGFESGAADYITKPVNPSTVKARVKAYLALSAQNNGGETDARKLTEPLLQDQNVANSALAALAEFRDGENTGHIIRIRRYFRAMTELLASRPRFREHLDDGKAELMRRASVIHDIGKISVPDEILLKPGRLTENEFEAVKKHVVYGAKALTESEKALGYDNSTPFLEMSREIVLTHHEHWDGSGYPYGLQGEKIPLGGRIMALLDVYDALIGKRVYKKPYSHENALEIITKGDEQTRAEHFDPEILAVFRESNDRFRKIALECPDHEEGREVPAQADD